MKFFWPAPLDLIDPTYNFIEERGYYNAAKHKHQKYPHEVFDSQLYHGFVISKIYIDKGKGCRWNSSQLNRFIREGAKRFLKFPTVYNLTVMGDSGAFTRSSQYQIDVQLIDECLEVVDFYNAIGVDYGLSPDNVIGGFLKLESSKNFIKIIGEWDKRWNRTIELAACFFHLCKKKKVKWIPIGVAQGWDLTSYQKSVRELQQIGYEYIALGGLNSLQNQDIISVVKSCYEIKNRSTKFHLLGVSRLEHIEDFEKYGVESFDSSMPIRQAINDDKNNYHFTGKNYLAIRVPQTENSPRIKHLIKEGKASKQSLLAIERETLDALRLFDKGKKDLQEVLDLLKMGIEYRYEKNFLKEYTSLLIDQPWKKCTCSMCKQYGIEIIIMRNRERNLRRGFHNLFLFSTKFNKISSNLK